MSDAKHKPVLWGWYWTQEQGWIYGPIVEEKAKNPEARDA